MFPLQFAHAFAKLRESHPLKNFHDRIPHLFHDATDAAVVFVRAGAALVETFAHATHRRQRAFDVTDDFGQCDLLWMACQTVPARHTSPAFQDAARAEFVENLLEEFARDVLKSSNGLNWHDRAV